jgi:hypothetical protein
MSASLQWRSAHPATFGPRDTSWKRVDVPAANQALTSCRVASDAAAFGLLNLPDGPDWAWRPESDCSTGPSSRPSPWWDGSLMLGS